MRLKTRMRRGVGILDPLTIRTTHTRAHTHTHEELVEFTATCMTCWLVCSFGTLRRARASATSETTR